jgi:F420-non-reducing hydrogenase iron-sulfur subunit
MRIVAFLCNWCSYEASTAAGSKRLACPSDVAFVRVLCTGMVSPQAVLAAFAQGADGVMILGCHPGDCHYQAGNTHAIRRVAVLKNLLSQWGIAPERLKLDWASASESDRFAQLVNSFHEKISGMGKLPEPTVTIDGESAR